MSASSSTRPAGSVGISTLPPHSTVALMAAAGKAGGRAGELGGRRGRESQAAWEDRLVCSRCRPLQGLDALHQ